MFGQKSCCFYDIRPYTSLLKDELLDEFLKALNRIADLKEGEFPKSVSIFYRYLIY